MNGICSYCKSPCNHNYNGATFCTKNKECTRAREQYYRKGEVKGYSVVDCETCSGIRLVTPGHEYKTRFCLFCYRERVRASKRKKPPKRECAECGKEYVSTRYRYCSKTCLRDAKNAKSLKRYHKNKEEQRDETPEIGKAQIISKDWPEGYGIFHWGTIREDAERGTWPEDAVFQDINDPSIRFKVQSRQGTMDDETLAEQTLERVK